MGFETPNVPLGSSHHPVRLVVVSAKDLAVSSAFYAQVFGWQVSPMSAELASAVTPAGPAVALRASVAAGIPAVIPYIGVSDVDAMLARLVAAGGTVEKGSWAIPGVGTLARFRDPDGTLYGLTDAQSPGATPPIAMPFGSNPRPPANAICSLEMYAADGAAAARFFGDMFGWAAQATLPQFVAFDPGAGIGGVFQSHTPAASAMAYIYVDDVAAALSQVEAAGGKRLGEPMSMPEMACFGYFTDPSGTAMGLIGP